MTRHRAAALLLAAVVGYGACSPSDEPSAEPEETPTSPPTSVAPTQDAPADCPEPRRSARAEFDPALHDELIRMLKRDQAGIDGARGFDVRTERLREILTEHGWPGFDLVGRDGEDAAWAIAQHADHDVDFQRCALVLLEEAVARGQGSPGNAAYLGDRVAVSAGEPQRYGTQVGCGPQGPEPATPLVDPDRVDEWRARADLPPYQDYLDEMAHLCATD
jgi:hypothetical protein